MSLWSQLLWRKAKNTDDIEESDEELIEKLIVELNKESDEDSDEELTEVKIPKNNKNKADWYDTNQFQIILTTIDSNKFNHKNKIGKLKFNDINSLINNIKNNTVSEADARTKLNALNEIKKAEIKSDNDNENEIKKENENENENKNENESESDSENNDCEKC